MELIERTVSVVGGSLNKTIAFKVRWFRCVIAIAILATLTETCLAQDDRIDVERIVASGLDIQYGNHVTVITDARDRSDVAEFTHVFDLAVEQWCDYFAIDPQRTRDWKLVACVIVDKERFVTAGLIPNDLPSFPAGFQLDDRIWFYVQPGDYYTRHLLLHEGTHAFMQNFLGGYGPPWYSEGMAELLAVHVWRDGILKIKHPVQTTEEVPWWGRVKLVRNDRDSGRGLALGEVIAVPNAAFQQVNSYGWAWMACDFLDRHPLLQKSFRELPSIIPVSPEKFNRYLLQAISDSGLSMQEIEFQWQMLVDEIDYGYDVARATPVVASETRAGDATTISVEAAHGWQKTEFRVEADTAYRISTEGMITIRNDGEPWPCDAGGVTIDYYRGRPLGELVAAVRPDDSAQSDSLQRMAIGRGEVIAFPIDGTLYLRVNESPTQLQDNSGEIQVTIRPDTD